MDKPNLDKFNLEKLNKGLNLEELSKSIDLDAVRNSIASATSTFQHINYLDNQVTDSIYRDKQEKIAREKRSIELQETIVDQNDQTIKMKEIELEFLRNMSEDTGQIVNLIKSLEAINLANGKVSEENLLEIQNKLEKIIDNTDSESIYELFIGEVKEQLVEKGVSAALQTIFVGLKMLVANKTMT